MKYSRTRKDKKQSETEKLERYTHPLMGPSRTTMLGWPWIQ